jgi:hypothetical protein
VRRDGLAQVLTLTEGKTMKKVFLTTTAISLLAAGTAFAEEPTVSLGGHVDFQAGSADVDSTYETDANGFSRDTHTRTTADIIISVDGKADNGIAYGAEVVLNADAGNPEGTNGATENNAEEVSLYVESGFGKVKAGSTRGSNAAIKVDAGSIARATGGISGDFYNYADFDGVEGGTGDNFVVTPDLPSTGRPGIYGGDTENVNATANKISYYSPRISGVQAGLSYTPDLNERGNSNGFSGDGDANSIENLVEAGLNYQGQYDQVGIEASVTAEYGSLEDRGTNEGNNAVADDGVEAYAYGIAVDYAGVTFAGSYGYADEFGTVNDEQEYSYFTLGAAYEFGPIGASATYLSSEVEKGEGNNSATSKDAEFTNFVVGLDYQLAPGLVPYVEASFFETDDNTTDTDNDGTIFIVGTGLSF